MAAFDPNMKPDPPQSSLTFHHPPTHTKCTPSPKVKRQFEEQQRKALDDQRKERERLRLIQLDEEARAKEKAEQDRQDKAEADRKLQAMLAEQQHATQMQAQKQAEMQAKMQVRWLCTPVREGVAINT